MSDTYEGEYPYPIPSDARDALVDAARMDGTTCARGAYKARRTVKEPDPKMRPGVTEHVVRLSHRDNNDRIVDVAVTPFDDLRDDWERPSPCDPGEVVLPVDEYGLADVFVDPTVLPTPNDDEQHRLANAEPATVPDDADRDEHGEAVFPDAEGDASSEYLSCFKWERNPDAHWNHYPGAAEQYDTHEGDDE